MLHRIEYCKTTNSPGGWRTARKWSHTPQPARCSYRPVTCPGHPQQPSRPQLLGKPGRCAIHATQHHWDTERRQWFCALCERTISYAVAREPEPTHPFDDIAPKLSWAYKDHAAGKITSEVLCAIIENAEWVAWAAGQPRAGLPRATGPAPCPCCHEQVLYADQDGQWAEWVQTRPCSTASGVVKPRAAGANLTVEVDASGPIIGGLRPVQAQGHTIPVSYPELTKPRIDSVIRNGKGCIIRPGTPTHGANFNNLFGARVRPGDPSLLAHIFVSPHATRITAADIRNYAPSTRLSVESKQRKDLIAAFCHNTARPEQGVQYRAGQTTDIAVDSRYPEGIG